MAEVSKDRRCEVALKNKEKELAVEEERVVKERMLEQTEREKLVALAVIEKDEIVQEKKKSIADIVRQRVAVERTVAEEEEETKNARAFSGAEKEKQVAVAMAAKDAESKFILEIKAAEAVKEFDSVGRSHEEFKLRLSLEEKLQLEKLKTQKDVALAQAEILGIVHSMLEKGKDNQLVAIMRSIKESGISSSTLKNLSVAAVLGKLAASAEGDEFMSAIS